MNCVCVCAHHVLAFALCPVSLLNVAIRPSEQLEAFGKQNIDRPVHMVDSFRMAKALQVVNIAIFFCIPALKMDFYVELLPILIAMASISVQSQTFCLRPENDLYALHARVCVRVCIS